MDVTDNHPSPTNSPPPEGEAIPPHKREEAHLLEPTAAADPQDPSSSLKRQSARSHAGASKRREANLRALQDAIQNGTYHVSDEQLADKMLRHLLRDVLPSLSPLEGHAE
jgi:anti-sigma28 factor (negative regulator of flagellin synthesis)